MKRKRDVDGGPSAATWPGFTRDGHFFRSDAPVSNDVTLFVRRAVRLVRDQRLPPADLLVEVLKEGEAVRSLFVGVAGQWSALTRYHEWPCAASTSSVHEAIKRQGLGDRPPWVAEAAWGEACDRSERERGQSPRSEYPPVTVVDSVLDLLGEGWK